MAVGSCKSTLISIVVYIFVVVAGAVIIMFMEREGIKKTAKQDEDRPGNKTSMQKNLTSHTKQYLENHGSPSWTLEDVENMIKEIKSFEKKARKTSDNDDRENWRQEISFESFANWEYFVVVSLSTIGYGDITPITAGGKILTILVTLIGVPVNWYMFVSIAAVLAKGVACLKNLACSKCQKRRSCKPDMICFFFCIVILLLYVGAGGIAVGLSEGWKWHGSLYWSFTSCTTIGYGDLIPKSKAKFAFVYLGVIIMIMPVYAITQALQEDEETMEEDRLMAKVEDV